jgi:hypothetical protein
MIPRRWFLGSAVAALLAALGLRRRRSTKTGIRIPGKRLDRDRLRDPHDLRG